MSDFLNKEKVPRMPPWSMVEIEAVSTRLLELLCPDALKQATALDVCTLVEFTLPKHRVHVYPANEIELGDRLAATDPSGEHDINILIAVELWDQLFAGGRMANRARATIGHELAHAVMHVPVVRRRLKSPLGQMALNRVRRDALKAYEDPEWQAWALAGCFLAPRKAIESTDTTDLHELAEMFGVSEGMMKAHVKRLRLTGRFQSL